MRLIRKSSHNRGFTIVELLIVIVVIAILAVISVASFTNVQSRALENSIRSNLSSISKQLELKKVDLGRYPENATEITPINVSRDYLDKTANNVYYCLDIPSQVYSIGLRAKNRKGYMLSNGKVTEVTTVNGLATCNSHRTL